MAPQVGGHDDHRVPEVHGAAVAVGQPAVVEELEQDVEDVAVGLFDLVEEDHRVRPPPHGLGELAALLVADVAWRRADEPGHRVLLHVLGHVEPDHGALVVEEELRQRPGQLGLSHAGGPQEEERADGPVGIAEARARAAHGVGHRPDRLVLPHHAPSQPLLHADELLDLALEEAGDRDARPLGHGLGDVLLVHLFLQHLARLLELGEPRVLGPEPLFQLEERAVAELGGPVEVAPPLGVGHALPRRLDLLLDLPDLGDGGLLRLPLGLEPRPLLRQVGELGVDPGQPLLRDLVGLPGHGDALDLELHGPPLDLVDRNRHRIDFNPET